MKKIAVVFGTRPEAIKLAPIIDELNICHERFKLLICVTAQHRQMLNQVLNIFKIRPDYDLNIMTKNQDLFAVTVKAIDGLKEIFLKEHPDMVLVQGDTTTTFAAGLSAYYLKIPVGHVEAGLRTYDKYQPFPEEINRRMATILSDYHFAPTKKAESNLIAENIPRNRIWITGNTGIDALLKVVENQQNPSIQEEYASYFQHEYNLMLSCKDRKLILVTGHRRENFGEGFRNICLALRKISENNPNVHIIYPVHLNPNVQGPVFDILKDDANGNAYSNRIHLIDPLDYGHFTYLMNKSYLILTDSGGIQEEAPSLAKPVLIMRNMTERPEGIEAGNAKLVGTDLDKITAEVQRLIDDKKAYFEMSSKANPYGDGHAATRIVKIISEICGES